ncbi:18381_t:CDS:2, partial [Gigaspora rosea]
KKLDNSSLELIVSASKKKITMLEAGVQEITPKKESSKESKRQYKKHLRKMERPTTDKRKFT